MVKSEWDHTDSGSRICPGGEMGRRWSGWPSVA